MELNHSTTSFKHMCYVNKLAYCLLVSAYEIKPLQSIGVEHHFQMQSVANYSIMLLFIVIHVIITAQRDTCVFKLGADVGGECIA